MFCFSFPAMKMIQGIRRQLIFELKRLNLLPSDLITAEEPDLNKYSHEWTMVQAAIVAGCFPDIAYVRPGTKLRKIKTRTQDNAALHPSSIIKRQVQPSHKRSAVLNRVEEDENETLAEYFAYQELTRIDEGLTLKMITVICSYFLFKITSN
jgi:hypothetical protein